MNKDDNNDTNSERKNTNINKQQHEEQEGQGEQITRTTREITKTRKQ